MEKKDLYLSDGEINKAHAQGVYECMNLHKHKGSTPRKEGRKAIAKASADYAVKKVIECLVQYETSRWGTTPDGTGSLDVSPYHWQALKKLIET